MSKILFLRKYINAPIQLLLIIPFSAFLTIVCGYRASNDVVNFSDGLENILNGYYIAHGYSAYRDFATNHFPGIFLYLGLIFKFLGFGGCLPSDKTRIGAIYGGVFATLLFQALCLFLVFRKLRWNSWGFFSFGAALMIYVSTRWNATIPLSETFHLYLFMLWPILIFRIFLSLDLRESSFNSILLLIPFSAISIWLGLTNLPTTLIGSLVAVMHCICHRKECLNELRTNRVLLLFTLLSVLLVLVTLITCDLRLLYFYNFPFNAPLRPASLLSALMTSLKEHGLHFYFLHDLAKTLRGTVLLLVLISFLIRHQKRNRIKLLFFSIVVAIGAGLTTWRVSLGYKTMGLWGINLGLFFILANEALLITQITRQDFPAYWSRLGIVGTLGLIALSMRHSQNISTSYQEIGFALIKTSSLSSRALPFESAALCRLGQLSGCSCVRHSIWAPQFYLSHNVQQCPGWGIWNPLVGVNDFTRKKLFDDIRGRRVAFILSPKESREYFAFPADASKMIQNHFRCSDIQGERDTKICYPKKS